MTTENRFETIIIGAGPAGLFTAGNISREATAVFEKNSSAGKKLLVSGSGQCNFTHSGSIGDFFGHYGDNSGFIKPALRKFTNIDIIDFFRKNGCESMPDKNGKVFPKSLKAGDILRLLTKECERKNVRFFHETPDFSAEKKEDGFTIKTACAEFLCRNLVISTGGLSYPKTGSTGDGYKLAEQLGHSITQPKPSLTPVYVESCRISGLAGVSLRNAEISIFRNSQKIKTHAGDIGFTHHGLSGPGILDLSRFMQCGDIIKLNLSGTNTSDFQKSLVEASQTNGKMALPLFLRGYAIPRSLVKSVLDSLNIPEQTNLANVTREMRRRLAEEFCAFPLTIGKLGGFDEAMATKGGVSLDEVNPSTMESRIVANLYFAGEVLDIDGDTGGYNIQAAFSTAYCAACAISTGYL